MIKTIMFYYPLLVLIVIIGGILLFWWKNITLTFKMENRTKMLIIWFLFSFVWWTQSHISGKYSLAFGIPLFIISGKVLSDVYGKQKILAVAGIVLLVCFYSISGFIFVADFRSIDAYSISDKIGSLNKEVYHYEQEIAFLSKTPTFPKDWDNSTSHMGTEGQWIKYHDYNGTAMDYLIKVKPEYILLSRTTHQLDYTPRGEFITLVRKYGKLYEQEGRYNIYELNWDNPNKEPLEIAFLPPEVGYDPITQVKKWLVPR